MFLCVSSTLTCLEQKLSEKLDFEDQPGDRYKPGIQSVQSSEIWGERKEFNCDGYRRTCRILFETDNSLL